MIIVLLIILLVGTTVFAYNMYEAYKSMKELEKLNKAAEDEITDLKIVLRDIGGICDDALTSTLLVTSRHALKVIKSTINSIN